MTRPAAASADARPGGGVRRSVVAGGDERGGGDGSRRRRRRRQGSAAPVRRSGSSCAGGCSGAALRKPVVRRFVRRRFATGAWRSRCGGARTRASPARRARIRPASGGCSASAGCGVTGPAVADTLRQARGTAAFPPAGRRRRRSRVRGNTHSTLPKRRMSPSCSAPWVTEISLSVAVPYGAEVAEMVFAVFQGDLGLATVGRGRQDHRVEHAVAERDVVAFDLAREGGAVAGV